MGDVAFEFEHIIENSEREWIQDKMADVVNAPPSREQRRRAFFRLLECEAFTNFQMSTFNTSKRFGLDGTDTFISGLLAMFDKAADIGAEQFMLGMAHRGRINALCNVFKKPYDEVIGDFLDFNPTEGKNIPYMFQGDVKYHKGYKSLQQFGIQNPRQVTLVIYTCRGDAV
jgi:2-oxoglutarate dehydrogenase E1 component